MELSKPHWRKSSYSAQNGGNCVELAQWRRSSRSGQNGGDCVEVAALSTVIGVRDSKDPGRAVLEFGRAALAGFFAATKAGAYDR